LAFGQLGICLLGSGILLRGVVTDRASRCSANQSVVCRYVAADAADRGSLQASLCGYQSWRKCE
jgi:hypothetical protein